jgi:alanine racemase
MKKFKIFILVFLTGLVFHSSADIALANSPAGEKTVCPKKNETKELQVKSAWIEISPDNYRQNIKRIKSLIGKNVKLCVVMKSDAYGHGLKILAPVAVASSPAYIAAVDNPEFRILASEIKKQGSDVKLLRIAPPLHFELVECIRNDWKVEEVVGSLELARMISNTARDLSKILQQNVQVGIHLNIETGMGRMAFRNIEDIRKAMVLPHLKVKGVMTHFAKVYEENDKGLPMTLKQCDKFKNVVKQLNLPSDVIRHVANSGAAAMYPEMRLDMVRCGALTYGEDLDDRLDPNHKLKPVITAFKAKVGIINRHVPPGATVGYDSDGIAAPGHQSTMAAVRVGTYQGIPQTGFKNNMKVLIKGQKFPVIGKSSMNILVVDISKQDVRNPVAIGDEVVIIGKQGDQQITVLDFAKYMDKDPTSAMMTIGCLNPKVVVQSK